MTDIVIRIDNLNKLHYLDTLHHRSNQLRVMKNVAFEVKRGEVVSIIGRNCTGK